MSIRNLYPKARPQTIYNVINGRPELPAASTFSRASEATYVDSAGIIQTAAVDEPRFNYDPETGEFLGLMLEQAGTNFRPYSEDLAYRGSGDGWTSGESSWTVQNSTAYGPGGTGTYTQIEAISGGTSAFGGKTYMNAATNEDTTISIYYKRVNCDYVWFAKQLRQSGFKSAYFDLNLVESYLNKDAPGYKAPAEDCTIKALGDDWFYLQFTCTEDDNGGSERMYLLPLKEKFPTTSGSGVPTVVLTDERFSAWGAQAEKNTRISSSYIRNDGTNTSVTRSPEAFSLTTSNNFDGGFSLLLDSETTTEDFIYKVKANGVTIAELNNANGTLDWNINGQSAAINGEYPQVGAIQPGRVRTVSSFGAADGTTQVNYLYTEGLSFPTNAIVAPGADELEFGPGQTLKAAYLWNGQLSNTEAVSVIKGEYNIVPSEPIKADSYSFVYNTDPTNSGETSITLASIVPTVSMRVYWGDGTSSAYEQGVTPSHTYPYPGQYRIQIEADDGFDGWRLGKSPTPNNSITRVDQWAPQHRVDDSGPGFTGDGLVSLLMYQSTCTSIPDFKYDDSITTLANTFYNCKKLSPNGWSFIPTNLPNCTTIQGAFTVAFYSAASVEEKGSFPTLQTSNKLKNVASAFQTTRTSAFTNNKPFSDSSEVTNWYNTFYDCRLTELDVDTSAATSLSGTFQNNSFVTSPYFYAPNCENFANIFNGNTNMTTMNPSISNGTYSNGTNFTSAWEGCSKLTSFPLIDTSSGTSFNSTWRDCGSLTSFPLLNTSSGTDFGVAWYYCSKLTSFPLLDTSSGTNFYSTWNTCTDLTSFPLLDTSSGESFQQAWQGCSGLTSFPLLNTSSGTNFTSAWENCSGLTSFPLINIPNADKLNSAWRTCNQLATFPTINTSSVTNFTSAWRGCSALTSFPVLNTSNGTAFGSTWRSCTGLTSFPSLNLSSGTSFGYAWGSSTNLADFPANMFDTTGTLQSTAFDGAWFGCALTAQSIENILVSLDTNGASNIELGIGGGTNAAKSTWTAAANTAYTNLITKGWTITFNP